MRRACAVASARRPLGHPARRLRGSRGRERASPDLWDAQRRRGRTGRGRGRGAESPGTDLAPPSACRAYVYRTPRPRRRSRALFSAPPRAPSLRRRRALGRLARPGRGRRAAGVGGWRAGRGAAEGHSCVAPRPWAPSPPHPCVRAPGRRVVGRERVTFAPVARGGARRGAGPTIVEASTTPPGQAGVRYPSVPPFLDATQTRPNPLLFYGSLTSPWPSGFPSPRWSPETEESRIGRKGVGRPLRRPSVRLSPLDRLPLSTPTPVDTSSSCLA